MKKFYYPIGAVIVAAMATFAYQNHESAKYSDIALENIEAISSTELPGDETRDKYCEPFANQVCPLEWKLGNSDEVNTTIFFGYWPKYDDI